MKKEGFYVLDRDFYELGHVLFGIHDPAKVKELLDTVKNFFNIKDDQTINICLSILLKNYFDGLDFLAANDISKKFMPPLLDMFAICYSIGAISALHKNSGNEQSKNKKNNCFVSDDDQQQDDKLKESDSISGSELKS